MDFPPRLFMKVTHAKKPCMNAMQYQGHFYFPEKKASKNKLHSIFSTAQFITWSSNDILLTVDVSSSLKFL